jgi:hypothetical protein
MINLKILSSVAAIALVLPMAVPSDSFAQQFKGGKGGVAVGGGRGAPAARFSGGGAPAARFSTGAAPVAHYNGPGASSMARYSGVTTGGARTARWSGATTGTRFSTGPSVTRYSAGYGGWNGGYRHRRSGFFPGAVAGAVIGGALASSYPYYGYGSDYYDTGYYDDPGFYGDAAVVAAVPAPVGGDDAVAYCMQTYQSYDPASGTYLGYDGLQHPCP